MFSHIVVVWTDPAQPKAVDEVLAGAEKYLRPIPGVLSLHAGKMVGSQRPVVDQTYQLALNVTFATQQDHDNYQVHPLHIEFVEKVFKPRVRKLAVYDFE